MLLFPVDAQRGGSVKPAVRSGFVQYTVVESMEQGALDASDEHNEQSLR
jgi:hypothetical protein